jgi:hypothetical protein
MKYRKPLAFCILLFLQLLFVDAYSQCEAKIEYKILPRSKGLSDLTVKSIGNSKDLRIQLYDLNTGKIVDEQRTNATSNLNKPLFVNVKSSVYMFYIWVAGCNKPITFSGEQQGILIEN